MLRRQTLLPEHRFLFTLIAAAVLGTGCVSAPATVSTAPAPRSAGPEERQQQEPQTVTEALGDLP